jgi:osmotically-inducible protein OsmY
LSFGITNPKPTQEDKMTTNLRISSIVLVALLLAVAGCTAMTGQTAGQYVDDSTITASVKTQLVSDKAANLTRIDVDTTNQVVTLNGIVESAEQKARAEQLASRVNGVKSVKNNLQVQKKQ